MFDYKGYNKNKLLELCDKNLADTGLTDWKYWPSEVYSFGKHLRDYAFYPSLLPIYVYSNHGTTCSYKECGIPKHELENDAECMLCLDYKNTEFYKTRSDKPSYTQISSYVWYRRKNKIKPLDDARGTLVFPAHTTPDIDLASDLESYIEKLKALPEEYQPVCVCLHMHDINKGQHEIFLKHGIPVYTAGNANDCRFAERFYDILKNFKYTTSNMIGSYTYYSVEMGIPFFLYGDKPILINNNDPNLEKGEYKFQESDNYKMKYQLFSNLQKEITPEQKEFVEINLGIHHGLGRIQMAMVLYGAYFKRGNLFKDIFLAIKTKYKKGNL